MNFYTADLHLNHNNILKFEKRPYNSINDMNDDYIQKWNAKVSKNDPV